MISFRVAVAMLCVAPRLWAQVDQHALAEQLLHGDRDARSRALVQADVLGPRNFGPELRAAFVTLLENHNRAVAEALKQNKAIAEVESPELITHVAHMVTRLQDRRAIPALAGALGTSGSTLVRDALADFGEAAAGEVLRVVAASGRRYEAVDEGLLALRFMVERHSASPLSTTTLAQIRQVTRQRLSAPVSRPHQSFTTVWQAIDLAVALADPDLRRIVDSLAVNKAAVMSRGVEAPHLIQMTQARAASRLTGGPALPKYRSAAERERLLTTN